MYLPFYTKGKNFSFYASLFIGRFGEESCGNELCLLGGESFGSPSRKISRTVITYVRP